LSFASDFGPAPEGGCAPAIATSAAAANPAPAPIAAHRLAIHVLAIVPPFRAVVTPALPARLMPRL
jgi:hypothetical protein